MADQDPALEAEGQGNPERPEWLPENFESGEALLGSYKEAQRKITELSQHNKGLEESINSLSSQFEQFQAQANQPDPNAVQEQLAQAWEYDPLGTMQAIAAASAQQAIQQYQSSQKPSGVSPEDFAAYVADQQVAAKYSDYGDLKDKIREELENNPVYRNDSLWVNPELATSALDSAYQSVKAREMLAGNVQQAQADTRAMKLAAQSSVGASGRPDAPSQDAEEWAKIMAASPKRYYE